MREIPSFQSALVVEDDRPLAAALVAALQGQVESVAWSFSTSEARELLLRLQPDLLVLDVMLPDGTAFDVLNSVRESGRSPAVIAISGCADPEETFQLAAQGVRAFLKKPLSLDALKKAIVRARMNPPDLIPHLRATVGRTGVREVEAQVRRVMVREALACSGGNRRGAARLLSVSRELLAAHSENL